MSEGPGSAEVHPLATTSAASARVGGIVDKYRIVRVLGQGGMGAVFEARHLRLDRRFAIKFLLPRHAENPDVLRRFENEAKAAGGLEHPNLAAVVDFGRAEDGSPYIVMEFLEGRDCARLLRDHGRMTVQRATNILVQACRGVAKAHGAGIVHRDLKPENLFVVDAGDGADLVKVLDFGIAKLRTMEAGPATGTGEMFGTAHYMSPEQARGAGEVDHRTDVWSLGVVLYELLSGRKPFEGRTFLDLVYQIQTFDPPPLATIEPDLPRALTEIVGRAMARDLHRRTASVMALADELSAFLPTKREAQASTQLSPETRDPSAGDHGPVPSRSPGPRRPSSFAVASDERERPRSRLMASVVMVLILAAGGIALYMRSARTGGEPVRGGSANPPAGQSREPSATASNGRGASTKAVESAPGDVAPGATEGAEGPKPSKLPNGTDTVPEPSAATKKVPSARRPAPASVRVSSPEAQAIVPSRIKPAATPEPRRAGRPIYIDKEDPFGP